jgi:hypothetical protein
MKYCSIAVATTGLNPRSNDVLEFSAIIEDTHHLKLLENCPKIQRWIDKEFYRGNPQALASSSHIFTKICELREKKSKRLIISDDLSIHFANLLRPHFTEGSIFKRPITIAGKNFATFDNLFLSRLKNFKNIPLNPRILDPSNFFIDWENDNEPPTFVECKRRCGINPDLPADTMALAWNIIEILRTKYQKISAKNPTQIAEEIFKPIKEMFDEARNPIEKHYLV